MSAVHFGRWVLPRGWTVPRAHALAVLADHGTARESNRTDSDGEGRIYWQTANWLVEEGYADLRVGPVGWWYDLTAKGRDLIKELGPRTPEPTNAQGGTQ